MFLNEKMTARPPQQNGEQRQSDQANSAACGGQSDDFARG